MGQSKAKKPRWCYWCQGHHEMTSRELAEHEVQIKREAEEAYLRLEEEKADADSGT